MTIKKWNGWKVGLLLGALLPLLSVKVHAEWPTLSVGPASGETTEPIGPPHIVLPPLFSVVSTGVNAPPGMTVTPFTVWEGPWEDVTSVEWEKGSDADGWVPAEGVTSVAEIAGQHHTYLTITVTEPTQYRARVIFPYGSIVSDHVIPVSVIHVGGGKTPPVP